MNSVYIISPVVCIIAFVAAFVFLLRQKKRSSSSDKADEVEVQASSDLAVTNQEESVPRPTALHFGSDLSRPAVTLRSLSLSELPAVSKTPLIEPSLGVASRISALMQAAPSVLVAEAHRGRQLMEVVVNGQLVRAADGSGFRAMTMGKNGIEGHARLFEAKDLTNLVNAAAVWQLASVIVAQKHMADISRKLSEIKDAIKHLSNSLENERRASINGTFQYLQQAYHALTHGELSNAIRGELESCERDLLAVQNHLIEDIKDRILINPRDDDTFGTTSLHRNSVEKYQDISQAVGDLNICLRTRALSWYVLSLYPGEDALKNARRESIKHALNEYTELECLIERHCNVDLQRFKSRVTRDKTLTTQKLDIHGKAGKIREFLKEAQQETSTTLQETQTLLLERDRPTQLIIELVDGEVQHIRQRELVAA